MDPGSRVAEHRLSHIGAAESRHLQRRGRGRMRHWCLSGAANEGMWRNQPAPKQPRSRLGERPKEFAVAAGISTETMQSRRKPRHEPTRRQRRVAAGASPGRSEPRRHNRGSLCRRSGVGLIAVAYVVSRRAAACAIRRHSHQRAKPPTTAVLTQLSTPANWL